MSYFTPLIERRDKNENKFDIFISGYNLFWNSSNFRISETVLSQDTIDISSGSYTVRMWTTGTWHPVDQAFSTVRLIIATDFIELFPGESHELASFADIRQIGRKL